MDHQQLVAVMPWTIILQIGNLLLTMWLFKKFLLKPVQKILQQRQERVDADIAAAQDAKAEAERAKEEYAVSLEGAKEEAAQIVRNASKAAQDHGDQIVLEAKQEAAAIRAKAAVDIERERKNAVNEIKGDISDMAVAIASKVVEKEISEKEHEKLIAEFIERMGETV